VLTPGSVTRLFDIPGLAEHARGLKSTAESVYLRDHLLEQLELANIDDDKARIQARRTVVVVGASYSGTELVVQLQALADAAGKQMGFEPADVRFVLLDLAEQVMPEVGKKLGARVQAVLHERGIDVRLGVSLKEVHADHVVLTDDSRINTHRRMGDRSDRRPVDRQSRIADRTWSADGAGRSASARPRRCVRRG
jgi:NADH:ubiquinone reductase (H+-translocating)